MPKITEISQQAHNRERYSVFVDGEYAFSLSGEAVIENHLKAGLDANSLPLEKIVREDNYRKALAKAYKSLSVSAKSEKQLADYLYKKEFDEETVSAVVSHLRELDYINDLELASDFAENSKRYGKRAIEFKLKQKGIDESIIETVLANMSEDSQAENAYELAKKQISKYSKSEVYDKKRKLSAYLASHGFDWDTVREAVERVTDGQEDYD